MSYKYNGKFTKPAAVEAKEALPQVTVGMGVTEYLWSDSNAYKVIEVNKGGKQLVIQRYKTEFTRKINMGEILRSPEGIRLIDDPDGVKKIITFRKGGCWRQRGNPASMRYNVGEAIERYDSGF